MDDRSSPTESEIIEEIARELVRVHEDSYGTGATETHVHVVGDFVLVVLEIVLTPAEETLLEAGHADAVRATRESYQAAIAPTFKAVVERATGRTVSSFLSSMSVDPLYSAEIFRLEALR
jgi:uncharacterized protein YbcI